MCIGARSRVWAPVGKPPMYGTGLHGLSPKGKYIWGRGWALRCRPQTGKHLRAGLGFGVWAPNWKACWGGVWHKALVVGSVSLWRRLLAYWGRGGGLAFIFWAPNWNGHACRTRLWMRAPGWKAHVDRTGLWTLHIQDSLFQRVLASALGCIKPPPCCWH